MTTKNMLQAIINGQRALKEELVERIIRVEFDVTSLKKEQKKGFKDVNERLDKQGKYLAYLEEVPRQEKNLIRSPNRLKS